MHFCVMFVMRSATQPKMTAAALLWKYNVQYQQRAYISIFSLRKKCTSNFATRNLVLLPGSKSLLPLKKMNF